jgi:DNA invertase Pin-like site-specific DNA recombinase
VFFGQAGDFGGIRNEPNAESTNLSAFQRAKAAGVYKGGQVPVRKMKVQGLGATAIAKALGIGRASVYSVL